MAPSVCDIINEVDPGSADWVSRRTIPSPMEIVEPDPAWPETFATIKKLIIHALGTAALDVEHSGSTSVPGLPAKDVIDVDLTVADPSDETSYIPQLETAGFQFLLRDRSWYQHRLLCRYEPHVNLHVFGVDSPAMIRHRIFREWLRAHPDDRDWYAETKRTAMSQSSKQSETMDQYNARKEEVILAILRKAFQSLGYVE